MKLLLSGSSGLVGSTLVPFLPSLGTRVTRLVRKTPRIDEQAIFWDPSRGLLKADYVDGFDAVVHLAGEGIASGRWTKSKKARIRDSRVKGTRLLCEGLARVKNPPRTFICASAIGYYGNRGDQLLREDSSPGEGFLAEVCKEWEAQSAPLRDRGTRIIFLRFGLILSPKGGALGKMLPPFKMGFGGVMGSGNQYMSWIALDDAVAAIVHVLMNHSIRGPVNVVSPNPVRNYDFTRALGEALSAPTILPMPGVLARIIFGEMAKDLLLSSQRVEPTQLQKSGFQFGYPTLDNALRHLLPAKH